MGRCREVFQRQREAGNREVKETMLMISANMLTFGAAARTAGRVDGLGHEPLAGERAAAPEQKTAGDQETT